mmetsp:Transcript_45628/g.116759  ORF Transcript_45628/g.116759 Transcript_45628/m.116759 type:complete len:251 (-) Transcript_45628:222-974(-)
MSIDSYEMPCGMPPFVVLGGNARQMWPATASRGHSPALSRVASEMYFERLDYEPSVKQLRRMAKGRSISGPVCLSSTEQAAVNSSRRRTFSGDIGAPSSQSPHRSTLCSRLTTVPEKSGNEGSRPATAGVEVGFGVEAEDLIASLRASYQSTHEPAPKQPIPDFETWRATAGCNVTVKAGRATTASSKDKQDDYSPIISTVRTCGALMVAAPASNEDGFWAPGQDLWPSTPPSSQSCSMAPCTPGMQVAD